MASLSEKLRRERELRGISLKQISEDTKIGVRFLEALEQDRLDLIPGEFYRRSYLRAYARYLGLDEDRAVNAYLYANREAETPEEEAEAGESGALGGGRALVAVAVVVALIAAFWLLGARAPSASGGRDAPEPASASGSTPSAGRDEAPSEPAAPAEADAEPSRSSVPSLDAGLSADEPEPVAVTATGATEGTLRLRVEVTDSCWLEIRGDGEILTTGLKELGFRGEFTADREVRLWLGNAAGVSLWVNGQPLRPLGVSGQVRKDVAITPDNVAEFLEGEGAS